MKVKEINRLFEALEGYGYPPQEVANCLNYIVTEQPNFIEEEDAAIFERQMEKFFPDPVARASIMKRLVIASCAEEIEEDEEAETKESDYYLQQMLAAIAAIFEQTESFETAKSRFMSLLDE